MDIQENNKIFGERMHKQADDLILEYAEAVKCINNIKDLLKIKHWDGQKNYLGQYTSINALKFLINDAKVKLSKKAIKQAPSLRLTNIRQFNDPQEGKAIYDYLGNIKFINKDIRKNITNYKNSYIYVSSASMKSDELPMWEQYAQNATGIFLYYSNEYIQNILSKDSVALYRVCYLKKGEAIIPDKEDLSHKITTNLKTLKSIIKEKEEKHDIKYLRIINQYLKSISYLFKNAFYSYECEVRIVQDTRYLDNEIEIEKGNITEKRAPKLYSYILTDNGETRLPVVYDGLKLGPKACDIDYIGPYVSYCNGNKNFKISRSNIPFR